MCVGGSCRVDAGGVRGRSVIVSYALLWCCCGCKKSRRCVLPARPAGKAKHGIFYNRGGIIAWVWSHVNGVLLPWFGLAVCEGELLAYEVVYDVVLDFYLLFLQVAELLELFGGG